MRHETYRAIKGLPPQKSIKKVVGEPRVLDDLDDLNDPPDPIFVPSAEESPSVPEKPVITEDSENTLSFGTPEVEAVVDKKDSVPAKEVTQSESIPVSEVGPKEVDAQKQDTENTPVVIAKQEQVEQKTSVWKKFDTALRSTHVNYLLLGILLLSLVRLILQIGVTK